MLRRAEARVQDPIAPLRRAFPYEAGKLLAADFIEFSSSGAVYSRQQILDGLPKESPMELSAMDFSALLYI
jgi:hypothetical protein